MNRFSALRTMVGSFLVDTCTINEPPDTEFDPDEGTYADTIGDEVYFGRCWVRPTGGQRVVDVGEGAQSLRTFDVTLPWDTTGITINQLVTVNSSDDPHMIGRVLRVVDVQGGSDTAYRRLVCEDTLTVEGGS